MPYGLEVLGDYGNLQISQSGRNLELYKRYPSYNGERFDSDTWQIMAYRVNDSSKITGYEYFFKRKVSFSILDNVSADLDVYLFDYFVPKPGSLFEVYNEDGQVAFSEKGKYMSVLRMERRSVQSSDFPLVPWSYTGSDSSYTGQKEKLYYSIPITTPIRNDLAIVDLRNIFYRDVYYTKTGPLPGYTYPCYRWDFTKYRTYSSYIKWTDTSIDCYLYFIGTTNVNYSVEREFIPYELELDYNLSSSFTVMVLDVTGF